MEGEGAQKLDHQAQSVQPFETDKYSVEYMCGSKLSRGKGADATNRARNNNKQGRMLSYSQCILEMGMLECINVRMGFSLIGNWMGSLLQARIKIKVQWKV